MEIGRNNRNTNNRGWFGHRVGRMVGGMMEVHSPKTFSKSKKYLSGLPIIH